MYGTQKKSRVAEYEKKEKNMKTKIRTDKTNCFCDLSYYNSRRARLDEYEATGKQTERQTDKHR